MGRVAQGLARAQFEAAGSTTADCFFWKLWKQGFWVRIMGERDGIHEKHTS
jgi:hypothetical protein